MDPVSAISLVGSVVGITDVIIRSLKGLRALQTLYKSADTLIAVIVGWLHTIKDALDEIRVWIEGIKGRSAHASLLFKIEFAVGCCAVPLGTLCETIESVRRHADGDKLTSRGKLAYMLGEGEMKTMSLHLGNQVQALNLLMMAARCRTVQECDGVLQDAETRTALMRIQDDSSSYVNNNDTRSESALTERSVVTEHTNLLDTTFVFDDEVFDSQVYKNAFRRIVEERKLQRLDSGRTAADGRDEHTPGSPAGDRIDSIQETSGQHGDRFEPTTQNYGGLNPGPQGDAAAVDDEAYQLSRELDGSDDSSLVTEDGGVPLRPSDLTEGFRSRAGLLGAPRPPSSIASERSVAATIRENQDKSKDIEKTDLTSLMPDITKQTGDQDNETSIELGNVQVQPQPRRLVNRPDGPTDKKIERNMEPESDTRNQWRKSVKEWGVGWIAQLLPRRFSEVSSETIRSINIDRELRLWRARENCACKVLILGAGGSGKTTLLNNFKLDSGEAFRPEEREGYRAVIFKNLVDGVLGVLDAMHASGIPFQDPSAESHLQAMFMQYSDTYRIPRHALDAITALWQDADFQACLDKSHQYQLIESLSYFMRNAERISLADYVPTDDDILHTYTKTSGIQEATFVHSILNLHVIDIGGLRGERRRWIHCFESVSVLVFTVDISEYDQLLFEDETFTRMHESLTQFDSIVNSRWFAASNIIILFTKTDLLEAKLLISPLKRYFPDYGGSTLSEAKDYISSRYTSLSLRKDLIPAIFVCLTDQEETRRTLAGIGRAALDWLIQKALKATASES